MCVRTFEGESLGVLCTGSLLRIIHHSNPQMEMLVQFISRTIYFVLLTFCSPGNIKGNFNSNYRSGLIS